MTDINNIGIHNRTNHSSENEVWREPADFVGWMLSTFYALCHTWHSIGSILLWLRHLFFRQNSNLVAVETLPHRSTFKLLSSSRLKNAFLWKKPQMYTNFQSSTVYVASTKLSKWVWLWQWLSLHHLMRESHSAVVGDKNSCKSHVNE